MTDLFFLKALKDKLKGGTTKSIHLNVLPGRFATRLDLANLNYIKPDLAESFLELLLNTANFEFKISFDGIDLNAIQPEEQKKLGLLSKRLNSLNIENDDNYKEHGIKTFGFGFPLLIKPSRQDPRKIIKAPLFIWQLELTKATNKVNTWSILRNKSRNENGRTIDEEIHSVELNEVLLSYLKTDENILVPQLNEELLDDAIIDKDELIEECYKVLKALNPNTADAIRDSLFPKFTEPLTNIPDAETIESNTENIPWIHFGGVFGLFRTQKESIITDIEKIIEKFDDFDFENLVVENFTGTEHSAVETDPSQQEILNTLGIEPNKIIQGPPGTGKSQSLTALITNALANNLKCLVVCEKKTALDVIKNNLHRENEQLGALAAVIEDINKDRDGIVNSVRDRITNMSQLADFNETSYTTAREKMESAVFTLNEQHKQLAHKIYQGKSWTELVGVFLKCQNTADHAGLKNKLDYKQFQFNKDDNELTEIIAKIRTAKRLYSEVNRLDHPFEILNDILFKEDNPRGIQLMLEELALNTQLQLEKLESELLKQFSAYEIWLDKHYLKYYEALKKQISDYLLFTTANQEQFGKRFFQNDAFTRFQINALSIIFPKYKTLKNNRLEIVLQLSGIKEVQESLPYVEHSWLDEIKTDSLKIYVDNIKELNTRTDTWFKGIKLKKQQYLRDFSSSNLHPLYSKKTSLQNTENLFAQIVGNLTQRQILKRELPIPDNHNKKVAEISNLRSDMSSISANLEDFRVYYYWRKFYIELIPLHRFIIKSIIEIECSDWEASFTSWYYYWLLSINEHQDLPKNEEGIKELKESKEELKGRQIKSIISNWSKNQAVSALRLTQTYGAVRSLYNQRGSAGHKRNSLRKILSKDFEFFTDFFPVLMVSPSTCSSIVPLKEGLFDIVIFDEASQLRIEDTFPALMRGKIKVVSGDSQQMPPPSYFFQGGTTLLNPTEEDNDDEQMAGETAALKHNPNHSFELANSESLLEYAETSGFKPSLLKVHYRSQHPHLIDFSNHAFYGKRLIPMPAKQEYKSIQFIEVNGLYEDQMNKDEARQVVDILLNHIKPLKNGNFPTVGVATFNLYQRNLILEEIAKVRQINPEYDQRISDLGASLFVKNLENIQGDERDIIILSTTFGRKASGSFGQNFGPISNKTKGYKLLNVIITRARHKVFICSSIPNEAIQQYAQLITNEFSGNGIFYSYLAYSKAISNSSFEVAKQILDEVHQNSPHQFFSTDLISSVSESPFEEEVYIRLAEKIGPARLEQQHRVGGFRIDMVVKSVLTGKPILAIECDGAKYHSSNEAYAWDIFRQSQLEKQGFIFHRIWSTNWWFSAEKELDKLLAYILLIDHHERLEINPAIEDVHEVEEIIPIALRTGAKRKVTFSSIVTLKNPEGHILKIKFCNTNTKLSPKPDTNGVITISESSAMGTSLLGKPEGEVCQLGMLEYYYEILEVV